MNVQFLKRSLLLLLFLVLLPFGQAFAQLDISEDFYRGTVTELGEFEVTNRFGFEEGVQPVTVNYLKEGVEHEVNIIQQVNLDNSSDNVQLTEGSQVVVVKTDIEGQENFAIQETYRGAGLWWLFVAFVVLVLLVAGKQGLYSLGGLAITFGILVLWVIPQIVGGANPMVISFIGSVVMAAATLYLSHGFKKRTTLALVSTIFTLILAFALAILSVDGAQLFGTGTEEAMALTFGTFANLDLRGLLLGAIVIGTLGILDDVIVTQIATVEQIHKANKKLDLKELYKRGLSVGRDHITSIINTLVLAYVGVSFPLLIILVDWPRPLWVILNSEFMAEEVVRTLVGSMTLIIAVPIATLSAAWFYSRKNK